MSSFHTWPTKTKGYMLEREMARRKYLLGTTNLPFSRSIRWNKDKNLGRQHNIFFRNKNS